MVEEQDTPQVLEELTRSNAARPSLRYDRKKRTALKRLAIILLLISPLLVGIVFLTWQQWNLRGELQRLAGNNTPPTPAPVALVDTPSPAQAEELANSQSITAAELSSAQSDVISESDREIASLNSALEDLRQQMQAKEQQDLREWKLAEAEYLLEVANQRLELEHNASIAAQLLESVDEILEQHGDVDIFPVRQAIATELTALRSAVSLDSEALYFQIGTLATRLKAIPLLSNLHDEEMASLSRSDAAASSSGMSEQSLLSSGRAFLASVFVLRKWDETPDLRFPPRQEQYLEHSLQLQLEQAQLAVITRQSAIYLESLQACKTLLAQFFDTSAQQSQAVVAELDRMLALNIDPALPDISESRRLFAQFINDRNQQ